MFTVCPKCALTLVVTAADLRVAQGYVRCGRCSSVFNALARLADDRQASGAAVEAAPAPSDLPAASVADDGQPAPEEESAASAAEPHSEVPDEPSAPGAAAEGAERAEEDSIPEAALEFDPSRTDASLLFVEPPPDPNWTAATGSFKAMVAANQEAAAQEPRVSEVEVEIDADFLASMLRSDTASPAAAAPPPAPEAAAEVAARTAAAPAAAPASAPSPPAAPAAPAEPASPAPSARTRARGHHVSPHARPPQQAAARPVPPAPSAAAAAAPAPAPPAAPRREAAVRPAAPPSQGLLAGPDEEADADTAEVRPHWRTPLDRYAWPAGLALAVLVLLAQIVNHYRDDLAASTRFTRPLTALYGAFGVHLVPRWDLHAYDVRQLGADVDPAGTITVRASIKNAAQQAQPLPLLRVTLQDRFGNRIASSDVAPRFYLPHAIPPSSFLSAGQRIDAQMGFLDPGANAVGFELDACLPSGAGAITCANDVATR